MFAEPGETVPRASQGDSLYRPIFVGRHAELRRLRDAFDEALAGQPTVVVLAGEPGIGKTALCTRLATYVRERGSIAVSGVCPETESPSLAYLPIIQAVEACVASMNEAELVSALGSSAAEIARIVPRVRERLAIELRPPGDSEEDRWNLLQAVTAVLRNIAADKGLLLILEDLHAADRATLDVLVHLSRHMDNGRLMVLGTYRDEEVDRAHPLSATLAELRRSPRFTRVSLRGLTLAEVHDLYCRVRGQAVPWSRAESVHHQTEGNPLFVQEVLRYLVEAGLVVRREGGYSPTDVARMEADVPEGLRDVVGKRLSQLGGQTNDVLHIAAVIGRDFRLDVLQRVSEMSEAVVFEALEEAQARAIIEDIGGFGAQVRCRFTHAFFRQILYEETFAPRRIRWHRAVASVLEEVYGDQLEEHAGELAAHYAHSSDPRDLARALTYDELAAQRAMQVFAYGESARHLERALQVESVQEVRDPLKRSELLIELGEAMLAMQQPADAVVAVAAQAFGLAESGGSSSRAARAAVQALDALSRPWAPINIHHLSEMREWVTRADSHAAPESVERVYADIWLGVLAVVSGRPADVCAPLLRAENLARRLGDRRAYVAATGFALTQVMSLQHADEIAQLAAEFQSRPHERVRSSDLALALFGAGRLLFGAGDLEGAVQAWDELDHLASESQDPYTRLHAMAQLPLRAFSDGNLDQVVKCKEAEARFAELHGIERASNPFTDFTRARSLYYLGRASAELLDDVRGEQRPMKAFRAYLLSLLGRCDEALALRASFPGLESDDDATACMFVVLWLAVSTVCQDVQTATALVPRLSPLANRLDGWIGMSYGRVVGEAAVFLGRAVDARASFEAALAVCDKLRCRPELALTRLDLAELLLTSFPAEKSRALEQLQLAILDFQTMHMQPFLSRALELNESVAAANSSPIGGRPQRESAPSLDPLTEREREVAALIAQGLSNREIAAALVISEGTAEVHVKHVLGKLGFRSRAQVAAWAATRTRGV